MVVKEAYALGAHEVIVNGQMISLPQKKFLPCTDGSFGQCADYKIAEMNYLLGTG